MTGPHPFPSGLSALACYGCKRRKVKCNRALPACSLCDKLHGTCEYPSHPEKPGPKTGSSQRNKRRRLHHDRPGPSCSATNGGPSLGALGTAAPVVPAHPLGRRRRESSPTGPPIYSNVSDSSPPIPRRSSHTNAPIFSQIMYPSHEVQTRPQSPSTVDVPLAHRDGAVGATVDSVCAALGISKDMYDLLMDSYFTNMTSFTLFRPDSIEPKFTLMQHHSEAVALVAAMFSFSARHCSDLVGEDQNVCPSPSYFAQLALSNLDESLDRYGDTRPPFWLLQASILVTFHQLTRSVRSRSWRTLGDCIRLAYDLNLHIVDANHERVPGAQKSFISAGLERWSLLEERRRAWWAIWEMDIFASTIRRLPTAIDSNVNLTFLPVADTCWFNSVYQESCFLVPDPSLRWKRLARSGNNSSKAWFIVMNSLMRNTQRIVYPTGTAVQPNSDEHVAANHEELDIMANCLYCTITSLPPSLCYQGETLDFQVGQSIKQDSNARKDHADKYSIHLMTQLCRFMIYHHKICARAPWLASGVANNGEDSGTVLAPAAQVNSEWSNYMNASDQIVTVVRNSSRDHYKYVNPFLANTLWFAAATQCACRVFGPPTFNKRLATSNLDLLKLTIDRFVSFWNGMENLKGKLARVDAGLKSLMASARTANGAATASEKHQDDPPTGRDGEQSANTYVLPRNPTSPFSAVGQYSLSGTEPMLLDITKHGWADQPSTSSFPDLCDFTQPFAVTGQDFFASEMDVSSFGLEELLMSDMVPQV